ncbi:uncharacterized protein LOC122379893 [Amphibalanus amphitrite]|uniref:uncharacterized protein LOC122379893 n=1 Tax=Amphibalanus amphitrite TaxID=1232801 RepID=UPI001C90C7D1|nr:uncharacterized protein LOC122379893 [Amphibalanus amphitrite]
MDKDLADLSFLHSPNLHLVEDMDVLQAMQMALEPENANTQPSAPGAAMGRPAESTAGQPTASASGPAPPTEKVAPPSASGSAQGEPPSALLGQLLAPRSATAGPSAVRRPTGRRAGARTVVRARGAVRQAAAVRPVRAQAPVTISTSLPVITIGGRARREVAPGTATPAPRGKSPSQVVIVKPKATVNQTVTPSALNNNKRVIVVGPKTAAPRTRCPPVYTTRSVVPAVSIQPRPAAVTSAGASSTSTTPAVVQKVTLSGVRAQVVMVGGKERIVLYRRQPGERADAPGVGVLPVVPAGPRAAVSALPSGTQTTTAGGPSRTSVTAASTAGKTVSGPPRAAVGAAPAAGSAVSAAAEPPGKRGRTAEAPAVTSVMKVADKLADKGTHKTVGEAVLSSKPAKQVKVKAAVKLGVNAVAMIVPSPAPKLTVPPFVVPISGLTAEPVTQALASHTDTPNPETNTGTEKNPSGVINVRIANGCVTATTSGVPPVSVAPVTNRTPDAHVLHGRLERTAGPASVPLHSLRPPAPPPADRPLVVDDGEVQACEEPATVPPSGADGPEAGGRPSRVSVDEELQKAVSEIFDCVDSAAQSPQTADMLIDGLLEQVEGDGSGSSAAGGAQLQQAPAEPSSQDSQPPPPKPSDPPSTEPSSQDSQPPPPQPSDPPAVCSSSQDSQPPPAQPSDPPAGAPSPQDSQPPRTAPTDPPAAGPSSGSTESTAPRPGGRQRRRKDVLLPLARDTEHLELPPPPPESPPGQPPGPPPEPSPPRLIAVPPRRPLSPTPSPERRPISDPRELQSLLEEICSIDELAWNWSGFANITKKRKREEPDTKETHLFLNEFGLVEVLDRSARTAFSGSGRTACPRAGTGRQPDAICWCSVCGSYGCLADFTSGGEFCSRVCRDVSTGREALDKKRRGIDVKMQKTPSQKENMASIKSKGRKKDSQPLVYPGTGSFSWSVYLDALGRTLPTAVAAPDPKDGPPPARLPFFVGERLEAVDPRDPSLTCVCTVAEVSGSRLRLHFDGYSVRFDFWVESSSRDIFPCGWTERHRTNETDLQAPPGRRHAPFRWADYLRELRARAAPDAAFTCVIEDEKPIQRVEMEVRAGQRLEAADPAHPRHMRPARVAQVRDDRVLVAFDGAGGSPGYWAELSSPRLRPVTWAEENGVPVLPPSDWTETDGPFRWQTHLVRTRSLPVPARMLRTRNIPTLHPGMRVEAVDVRVPALVRVMHVVEVSRHGLVRLRPDGWRGAPDQWVAADGPGLHAPGWCRRTGHPLTPPVTRPQAGRCGTPGCAGLGNAGGPRYRRHIVTEQCPYREQREVTPDRRASALQEEKELDSVELPSPPAPATDPPPPPARKVVTLSRDISSIASEVTDTVFDKDAPAPERRGVWPTCKKLNTVDRFLAMHSAIHVWDAETVHRFLCHFGPTGDAGSSLDIIKDEEIDGEALLLLTRDDLCSLLKVSLGTATKIHNCIVRMRKRYNYRGRSANETATCRKAKA